MINEMFSFIDRLTDLIREKSLKVAPEGEFFTLASGKQSTYYLDLKQTILTAKGTFYVGCLMWKEIRHNLNQVDAVAGVALGGCSLATAVTSVSYLYNTVEDKPYDTLYVRKESKEHGTKSLIEGPVFPGMHVVLLEDVVTSGTSSMKAVKVLQDAGINVDMVLAVVDREEGGAELFAANGIPYKALVKVSNVLR